MVSSRRFVADSHSTGAEREKTRVDGMAMARRLFESGRLDEASAVIDRTVAADPADPARHALRATIRRAIGQPDQALLSCRRTAVLACGKAAAYANAAMCGVDLGDSTVARSGAMRAVTVDPGDARAWRLVSLGVGVDRDLSAVMAALRRSLVLAPATANVLLDLADASIRSGLTEPGDAAFRWAWVLTPGAMPLLFSWTRQLMSAGEHLAAAELLKHALVQTPERLETNVDLAVCQHAAAVLGPAEAQVLRTLRIAPDRSRFWNNLGGLLRSRGAIDQAAQRFLMAIVLDPADRISTTNLGIGFREIGRRDVAHKVFSWGVVLDPGRPVARVGRAIIDFQNGDTVSALRFLDGLDFAREVEKNFNFALGYKSLIQALAEQDQPRSPSLPESLHVVGDSHSLPPSRERVELHGRPHTVVSSLVVGVKAWHVADPAPNPYRSALLVALDRVPKGSMVVLTVGEIDTRLDDGIIPFCRKHGHSIDQVVDATANGFVERVVKEARGRGLTPMLHGVAAPIPDREVVSMEDATLWSRVVRAFNQRLREAAARHGVPFLDLHALTSDADGFSDGSYSLDGTHLQPRVLGLLTKRLKSPETSAKS